MQPTLCSRCHKNVAVIFISKLEGGETKNEGLCLKCARELGIKPIDDMMKKMGISDDDLDNLTNEMMSAFGGAEGMEGLLEAASLEAADTVLTAVVGIVGLRPTLAAIRAGKRIALANKETLVCAGELVSDAAAWSGSQVVPVDSEHSAIFQCLQGCQDRGEVRRLILTASGGPFWGWKGEDLAGVTVEQALAHPNWNMGAKISVDSATMMNKGLEFIEAMRLYHMPPEKISIVIHRESIVHSLVEYCDHAVLAQLGVPDMRLPIQYALTWPGRVAAVAEPLDLLSCPPPDLPCAGLCGVPLSGPGPGGRPHRRQRHGGAQRGQRGGRGAVPGRTALFFRHCGAGGLRHGRGSRGAVSLPGGHSGRGSGGAGGRAGTPARYALSKERCYDHPVHPDYHPALRRAHRHP